MSAYLVQQYLDLSAHKMCDKLAIFFEKESISYLELLNFSNRLANCLQRHGVRRGDRVLLVLPKSIKSIISMLGILKADAVYVPLDAGAPAHRSIEIIRDCNPSAMICDSSTIGLTQALLRMSESPTRVFVLSPENSELENVQKVAAWIEEIDAERMEEPSYENIDTDLAYILYTSGSTGKPKGVMVSHLNIMNYINWAVDYFGISATDNVLNTSPLHFDMSVFDIFCPIKVGGSLTLVPKSLQLFPVKLIEIMETRGISIWKAVSSLLSYFVRAKALDPTRLIDLKKVIFSGESLPTKYLIDWMRVYPEKEFYNAYGPTEATGISVCHKIECVPSSPFDPIPIGRACANTEIFAMNENGELAGVDEIGELYIKGSCLSLGYWNDPGRTNKAFVWNPFSKNYKERAYRTGDLVRLLTDGDYIFVGRKDDQVKYMGYRIEMGEIEAALHSLDLVNDAAAIAIPMNESDGIKIVAFVEPAAPLDSAVIMKKLKMKLTDYMLPKSIQLVGKIPRTDNGKVDRQRLKNEYLNNQNSKNFSRS